MKLLSRAGCALGLLSCLLLVRGATAQGVVATTGDEPFLLPSPTTEARFIRDAQLRPVGCDGPVTDQPLYEEPIDDQAGGAFLAAEPAPSCAEEEIYEWNVASRCCPGWNIYAGALVMQRSRNTPATIATPPTGTPGVLVDASRFAFEYDLGPEFILQRTTARGITWEGRYFGSLDSNAEFLVPNITTFRIAGIGVTILGGGPINSIYSSELHSTEINAWRQVTPGLSLLAGFRWVEFSDTLRVNISTPATFTRWDENNHLYGGQLGGKLSMFSPGSPLQFDAIAKAGVCGNVADTEFTSTIVAGDQSTGSGAAFVGEVNLSLAYQVTQHLTARAGYMVMWIDGVALAGETAAGTVQAPGGTNAATPLNGNVWYNGATFGFDYTF
jgi:hypothetical protein